jgi:hypothetical protein
MTASPVACGACRDPQAGPRAVQHESGNPWQSYLVCAQCGAPWRVVSVAEQLDPVLSPHATPRPDRAPVLRPPVDASIEARLRAVAERQARVVLACTGLPWRIRTELKFEHPDYALLNQRLASLADDIEAAYDDAKSMVPFDADDVMTLNAMAETADSEYGGASSATYLRDLATRLGDALQADRPRSSLDALRIELPPAAPSVPRVLPENYWREVWHDAPCRGPMKRHRETLAIEDGSVLALYECLACHVRVFAGLDATRRVVTRAAPQLPEGAR